MRPHPIRQTGPQPPGGTTELARGSPRGQERGNGRSARQSGLSCEALRREVKVDGGTEEGEGGQVRAAPR